MNANSKAEETKLFLKHFIVWFVIAAVVLVLFVGRLIQNAQAAKEPRGNNDAPKERVFDYADILTDIQEEDLRKYIAEKEARYHMDFVVVTANLLVEGPEAQEMYGYTTPYWENNMRDLADDFWDTNHFGFNTGFEGDGSLLLDNRYPGQRGEWLSTSGSVYVKMSDADVEYVLNGVDQLYDVDPYHAYINYIDRIIKKTTRGQFKIKYLFWGVVISFFITLFYWLSGKADKLASDTTAYTQYVEGGEPKVHISRDQFLRKNTTARKIETSSGGGRSGGGGGHVSSGGAHHGGGGHRH